MADIIYKGRIIKGVRSVAFPSASGGEVTFGEGGPSVAVEPLAVTENGEYTAPGGKAYSPVTVAVPWNWMGEDAECIDNNVHSFSSTLANTDFATWTPSTTAAVIVASENKTARAIDTGEYDYLLRWQFTADISYTAGVTMKAVPVRQAIEIWQAIIKRPSSYANLQIPTFTANACVTMLTAPVIDYYNTSGTHTVAWTASYGVYAAAVAATFSNSTSDTPNLTIKTPSISARCNSTYFATARGEYVDQANSEVKLRGELWRMKKSNTLEAMYMCVVDLYNNPIT